MQNLSLCAGSASTFVAEILNLDGLGKPNCQIKMDVPKHHGSDQAVDSIELKFSRQAPERDDGARSRGFDLIDTRRRRRARGSPVDAAMPLASGHRDRDMRNVRCAGRVNDNGLAIGLGRYNQICGEPDAVDFATNSCAGDRAR